MKQLIVIFFSLFFFTVYSQHEENKTEVIKGIYKGNNIYIRNPFGSNGVGFCMKSITVNGNRAAEIKGSVVELNFASLGIKLNDPLEILIEHNPDCMPSILNLDEIQLKPSNRKGFTSKSVLIHGTILDEITKKAISDVNVLTINKDNGSIVSFVSPGIGKGTYNIIANWGDVYELTFQSENEKFDYSIKKIIVDLRGIPENGDFNFKTKIEVEFLLSKKSNSLMDSLFSKFPVAKLAYNSFYKELRWDEEYTGAIRAASSSLLKQIEKEKEVNEKSILITNEQKQKKYLYAIIGFIFLITILSIYAFFRQKKLKDLVNLKMLEVEEQKHLVEEKHKEITDSINYAERIQRSFLATTELLDNSLNDYFVFFQPKDVVSGDFYWGSKLSSGDFVLVTADSTGHGVPGAIMSLLNITSLEKAIEQNLQPADILNVTRKIIIERLKKDGSIDGGKDGMDASLISLNFKNNKLTYSAANNPVWIIRQNEVIELKPDKMPVGKHDRDSEPFTQHNFELQAGDLLYTLTDGMPDQFGGPKGKKYMYKQLKELLISISNESMNLQREKLAQALQNWKGDLEQVDDICIIGIRI